VTRPTVLALASSILLLAGCRHRIEGIDGRRALQRVVHQVEAGPRIPGTPGHDAIRAWIVSELERLGAKVEVQETVDTLDGRRLDLRNITGRFGPTTGRPIVLMAHWDSRPWCDRDPDSTKLNDPMPGANDGGSGVAVLLEVAEVLHTRAPRVPVDLVFVDGEDQGRAHDDYCIGSREWANQFAGKPNDPGRPVAGFVFDMVGDKDLQIFPEAQSVARASNLVDLVLDAARATGAASFKPEPRWDVSDDHVSLLDAGIPAVDIIDFDYPAWHTHRDLPDQVSAQSLAEVASVAAWIVLESPLARPGS
jgi:glutaminyl-peptide cyclotransferase